MDYLTTFTGKSGRLLRGTANRLRGFGGGGVARQVRFEDYLREPAQGDPECGSPPHRPPAPSSPEGPGEPSLPSRPARPTRAEGGGQAEVWALRWGRGPAGRRRERGGRGARAGRWQVCRAGMAAGPGRGAEGSLCSGDGRLARVCVVAFPALLFLLSSPMLDFPYPANYFKGRIPSFFPPRER